MFLELENIRGVSSGMLCLVRFPSAKHTHAAVWGLVLPIPQTGVPSVLWTRFLTILTWLIPAQVCP